MLIVVWFVEASVSNPYQNRIKFLSVAVPKKSSQIVSWFQPSQGQGAGRWRKMIGGKVFYFGAELAPAETEATALVALWRRLRKEGHNEWPAGQPDRDVIRQALGINRFAGGDLLVTGAAPIAQPAAAGSTLVSSRRVAVGVLTLRDAANLYIAEKESEQISERTLRDTSQRLSRALDSIGKDRAVNSVDQATLVDFAAHWRKASSGSLVYAKHIVAAAKAFFVWASEHDKIQWSRPSRFDSILLIKADKPRNTEEWEALKAKRWGEDERFFEIPELQAIFAKADDRMRAWILLGLNAAYYPADICRLRKSDIRSGDSGLCIQTLRGKTMVKSRHPLWPETVAAMKRVQGTGPHGYWFETERHLRMHGKYGSRLISIAYAEVRDAVCPNAPDFKFLRHTSGNEIKRIGGSEVSEVHLAHTESFKLQSTYTDRLWEQHADAVAKLRGVFEPIWNPTTSHDRESQSSRKKTLLDGGLGTTAVRRSQSSRGLRA